MDVKQLEDEQLLHQLDTAAKTERHWQIAGLLLLAEVEKRRLHLKRGYKSLFEFCVIRFRWSEGSVYRRIQVARKGVQCPGLLDAIREQKMSLTVASIIAPHLSSGNVKQMVDEFQGLTRREAEDLLTAKGTAGVRKKRESIRLVGLAPEPGLPERGRSVANIDFSAPTSLSHGAVSEPKVTPTPGSLQSPPETQGPSSPSTPDSGPAAQQSAPAPEEIFSFRFTGNRRLRDKVMRAKEVMATRLETTDLDMVLEAALDCLLDKHDPKRKEIRLTKRREKQRQKERENERENERERASNENQKEMVRIAPVHRTEDAMPIANRSRYVKAAEQRKVMQRAGHRCEWTVDGRRCTSTTYLEIDHIHSFAMGGSNDSENLQVLCRLHNQLKARLEFGDVKIDQAIFAKAVLNP